MKTNEKLAYLMAKSGIKAPRLAGMLGVTRQAVNGWVNGKASISQENVEAICKVFHITEAEFRGILVEEKGGLVENQGELVRALKGQIDAQKQLIELLQIKLEDCQKNIPVPAIRVVQTEKIEK